MFARGTLVLGFLAAASLGLALWLNLPGEPPPAAVPGAGEPLIPGGGAMVANVSEIHLQSGQVKTTLQKGEAGWTILEKAGFPAATRKATALLDGLARSEKVAAKASDRARFLRMGLGESATTISLYDAAGSLLFSFAVGTQFLDPSSGRLLSYAFFEGLDRAWTASGFPPVGADPMAWAEREVIALSPARVKRVKVEFGERQGISLSRAEAVSYSFNAREFEGVDHDREGVNALAFALASVEAEDVAREGSLELFEVASAAYTAFDGLEVRVRFYDSEGVVWTAFAATYTPDVVDETDTPSVLPDAPPDGAAEAAALNARFSGWLFRLPLAKVSDILKTEESLRANPR